MNEPTLKELIEFCDNKSKNLEVGNVYQHIAWQLRSIRDFKDSTAKQK